MALRLNCKKNLKCKRGASYLIIIGMPGWYLCWYYLGIESGYHLYAKAAKQQ